MSAIPVTIGEFTFPTKSAAIDHFRHLLNSGGRDDEITDPEHITALSDLLHSRLKKIGELDGRTIIGWGREQGSRTMCFAALLDTGKKLHFSFRKSIDALADAQNIQQNND